MDLIARPRTDGVLIIRLSHVIAAGHGGDAFDALTRLGRTRQQMQDAIAVGRFFFHFVFVNRKRILCQFIICTTDKKKKNTIFKV